MASLSAAASSSSASSSRLSATRPIYSGLRHIHSRLSFHLQVLASQQGSTSLEDAKYGAPFKHGALFSVKAMDVSGRGPNESTIMISMTEKMHLSRSRARLCMSRELEKLPSKSFRKKMELPRGWCSDAALLAAFIRFPGLLSFTDFAHAESSSREVSQIYGDLGAGLELGVQVLYLAALLGLVGVASFFVVKQVLIRRELESAARDLQDRVRTGEALPVEYFELGAVMLRKKFYVLASKYLEQAIDKWDGDPQDLAQVHNALGYSLVSDGKIDKGIIEYQKAVKLQPGYVVAWNNLGSAHEKKKNLPKALEAYEQALMFDPNNRVAMEYRDALKKRVDRLVGIPVKYD